MIVCQLRLGLEDVNVAALLVKAIGVPVSNVPLSYKSTFPVVIPEPGAIGATETVKVLSVRRSRFSSIR